MQGKITKRTVECLSQSQFLFDTELRGFVARRLRSGRISYGLKYTDPKSGRQRWLGLGLSDGIGSIVPSVSNGWHIELGTGCPLYP